MPKSSSGSVETKQTLILASASKARAALLRGAGLNIEICPADIDETAMRAALGGGDSTVTTEDIAVILGEAKALHISEIRPNDYIIAGDQILAFEDDIMAKPQSIKQAYHQLMKLNGKTHRLESSVICARDGVTLWRHVSTAHMTMRQFSPAFLDNYLTALGDEALTSVGGYQLEGLGAQLFDKIDGDYFTVLGMPMLPLLAFLRAEGLLES